MRGSRYAVPILTIALVVAISIAVGVRGGHSEGTIAHEATQEPTFALAAEQPSHENFPSPEESKATPISGRTAVQPSLNTTAGEPAFTPQDVIDFLESDQHPFEMVPPGKTDPIIESIEFMSAGEAGERIGGGGVPTPNETLVCLVTMRGEFDANGDYSGNTSHLVFEGRTGNLLMYTVQSLSPAELATPALEELGLATLEVISPTPDPQATPYHEGLSAIAPNPAVQTGQPAITPEDVIAYLEQHPSMYEDPENPAPIVSIDFIAAKEVREKLEMSIGSPDDALICVVTLKGDFRLPAEDGWEYVRNGTGYVLFDATTGNSLAEGVRPW